MLLELIQLNMYYELSSCMKSVIQTHLATAFGLATIQTPISFFEVCGEHKGRGFFVWVKHGEFKRLPESNSVFLMCPPCPRKVIWFLC